MFSKILIANRGEIALRVIRACREMGIGSVAVYSDADARAPHVREADEAVHIGAPPSAESYLRGDRIVEAAQRMGAEAIHPGYGFLSEREWFARAVADAGLTFIGPPADAIAAIGSKTSARQLVTAANVPVVPGTTEALESADEARKIADQYGYPVLLKAAAGGGGKGMRLVRTAGEMQSSLDTARREAKNAFGDDAVYVEKYIEGPRHVEIQVLGDRHGTMLSLNERECSVQRRHQKMIEEAPSVAVTPELRHEMGATAVRAAQAAGYANAGTCEFLLDKNG
jgi:acetyl-CoA carboxylase biotin carboxylase subunit